MADGKKDKSAAEGEPNALDTEMNLRLPQAEAGDHAGQGEFSQLDRWFDAQLTRMYSDVVNEPLPKAFVELLEKLRERKNSR